MQCPTCFGARHVTCPACHGQGSSWKVVGNRTVWEPCYQCGGSRNAPCQTCGGTGTLPDPTPPGGPPPPKPKLPPNPALLQLEGRWKAQGARYEFVKQNGGYRVTQYNFLGMKIGEGEAEANGGVLTLTVRNKLVAVTADLELSGNRLSGTTRGLIRLPVTLKRA